jgi:hypothetical protein
MQVPAVLDSHVHGDGPTLLARPQHNASFANKHANARAGTQVRAEKAPSMDVAEMQEHTIKMVQHLHHEGEAEVPDEVCARAAVVRLICVCVGGGGRGARAVVARMPHAARQACIPARLQPCQGSSTACTH